MRNHTLLAVILTLVAPALHAQRDYEPDLKGYVTQVSSPTVFDVNGIHIRIDSNTRFYAKAKTYTGIAAADVKLYIGQPVQVYGKSHNKEHAISATQINLVQRKPSEMQGSGVVDTVLGSANSGEAMLRADGYVIRIPANCALTFTPPLTSATAYHPNVWIIFHGLQAQDGVITASKLSFGENQNDKGEERLREKTEHDPASVDPTAQQSTTSVFFGGLDPKQVPPFKDDIMQARVLAIGSKLVPKYQRDLPQEDPTKVDFRFQLVDEPKWVGVLAWPNGIILVPHQTVERLQNDSQLAEVLAFSISTVIEKQSRYFLPADHKLLPLQLAGLGVAPFLPVLPSIGMAALAMPSFGNNDVLRHVVEKGGRVSLDLMHDAGYDIHEAPRAWWLLADVKSKGSDKTPLPYLAEYLYKFLGETWRAQ